MLSVALLFFAALVIVNSKPSTAKSEGKNKSKNKRKSRRKDKAKNKPKSIKKFEWSNRLKPDNTPNAINKPNAKNHLYHGNPDSEASMASDMGVPLEKYCNLHESSI
jgi:hypothetical protein